MSAQEKKTKGGPDHVDKHVGQRLRIRRSLLGLSQEKLAEGIGLTFQQVQKYERGINRISAGRLFQLSKILDVPVTYFYEQTGPDGQIPSSLKSMGFADNDQQDFDSGNIMNEKETIDLVRAYYSIDDKDARKDILKFIKSMSERMK